MLLELVAERPNWMRALEVALIRPPGVPERRADQDPWAPPPTDRPRRISDDLSWLRAAIDEPQAHGLREITGTATVGAWQASDDAPDLHERFERLEQRGILDAAGFLLQ